MDGNEHRHSQSHLASNLAHGGARKDLHEMRADVSLCRQTIAQLRDLLDDLQRKQTEAISDIFKTVVFRLNGVKRVESPNKR
jgi:Spy/CpxP family protein refolding chaperone